MSGALPSAEQLLMRGNELLQNGDREGASLHYQAVLQINPCYAPAIANLGLIASDRNQLALAEIFNRRALMIQADNPNHWANYGNILARQERFDEALVAMEKAVGIGPDCAHAWYNLALLLNRLRRWAESQAALDRVEELGQSSPQCVEDRAHFYLYEGDLVRGLELYESRWEKLPHLEAWDFRIPEWRGEDLGGKHTLLHHEQGFGDTIMTARFAFDLVRRGAEVTLAVPNSLVNLFAVQHWPAIHSIDLEKLTFENTRKFDFQSPFWSAARWLGTTKESIDSKPYLKAPKLVVQNVDPRMVNIGICWASGKRNNENDIRRRISRLEDWLVFASHPQVQLHNLWKDGDAQAEIEEIGAQALVTNHVDSFRDFAETAAFVEKLDLIITVDTALVHLAGALGKPTWMISHLSNCWRWWDIKAGSALPWYDSVGIVQQIAPGDWKTPILKLQTILEPWIEAKFQRAEAA